MSRKRNWGLAGVGLELFAGLLMTMSFWLALPVGVIGLGFIAYGVFPDKCAHGYEVLRARYLMFLPEWPADHQITSIDPEITQIRSDVKQLIDTLSDFDLPEYQRDNVYERVDRIKNSDHSVWLDNENLRIARKNFVHWCKVAQAWREKHGSTFRNQDEKMRHFIISTTPPTGLMRA